MGARSRWRVHINIHRGRVVTVADMLRERWKVISQCKRCRLEMDMDLDLVVRVSGPDINLWGRKGKCRRRGCNGEVVFLAKAPGFGTGPDELTAWPVDGRE